MMPVPPRVEVFTGTARRRRWSAEEKAQIVAESYATSVGEAISALGRGIDDGIPGRWRKRGNGGGWTL